MHVDGGEAELVEGEAVEEAGEDVQGEFADDVVGGSPLF